ncbi:MAG: hypothetical protein HZA01_10450 [Nitrospinae bacterium]|nr:hypothetical protein [Nitrospinota bacterium]
MMNIFKIADLGFKSPILEAVLKKKFAQKGKHAIGIKNPLTHPGLRPPLSRGEFISDEGINE